jgi:hypothetical protein
MTTGTFFPQFAQLTDDMQILILSFVVRAPYECPSSATTATELSSVAEPTLVGGGLPAVSRKFRDYCRTSSLLWETVLQRAVRTQAVWKIAVEHVDPDWQRRLLQHPEPEPNTTARPGGGNNCSLMRFYRQVCTEQILFTGPVFCMGMQGAIPSRYELFLFEPRYRIMMQRLLDHHPVTARHGGAIEPPVHFLHAFAGLHINENNDNGNSNNNSSSPALLVQVQECRMLPDGSCAVTLVPTWFTRLERVWVLPHSGHLYYAASFKVRPADDA